MPRTKIADVCRVSPRPKLPAAQSLAALGAPDATSDLTLKHWEAVYCFPWKRGTVCIQAPVAKSGPAATPNPPVQLPGASVWERERCRNCHSQLGAPALSPIIATDRRALSQARMSLKGHQVLGNCLKQGLNLFLHFPSISHTSLSVRSGPCSWEKGAIK